MKATPTYQIPYPECDPPTVEDADDFPYDMRLMADRVDTLLNSLHVSTLNPIGYAQISGGTQNLPQNGFFSLPSISYANGDALDVDSLPSSLIVRRGGLYLITGWALTTSTMTPTFMRLDIEINRTLGRAESISPSQNGSVGRIQVLYPRICVPGDAISLGSSTSSGTVTYAQAHLSAALLIQI